MVARLLTLGLCALGMVTPTLAQADLNRWEAHTSYQSVRALAWDGESVWAATRGGVFSYLTATGEINRYSIVDGMHSVETRTIAADPERGLVWIGYGNGVLDRLNTASGMVTTYRDIERATQFAARGVNAITVRGDSLLVSTDFGVVVFDPERNEVRDAYTRFGSFSPAIAARNAVVAPGDAGEARLWVASAEGLASAPLSSQNLQDPTSWSTESGVFSGSESDVTAVAWFEGRIWVGTTGDLYVRNAGGTYERKFVSSSGITALLPSDGRMFGAQRFNPIVVETGGQARSLALGEYQDPTSVAFTGGSQVWIGDALGGLLAIDVPGPADATARLQGTVVPEGPSEGQFTDLTFGLDGSLWATGSGSVGSGFFRLGPEGRWTTFAEATESVLQGMGRFRKIAVDREGNVWAGSEGNGVALVDAAGSVQRFDPANSSLAPAPGTTDFVIVGGLDTDTDDNLWVSTRATASPLHVRTAAGEWAAFGPYVGDGLSAQSTAYGRVFVDSFDQKWIIIRSEANFGLVRGLMVLDSGSSITDSADDSFQFFDEPGAAGVGLPSVSVSAVVEDRDGQIWVGTETGIAFFINTGIVARDQTARPLWPQWADRSLGNFVLSGLRVNDLAVDPANRLWVATNEGAWLIEPVEGGFALAEHFTTDNSPLFSDEVVAVEVNPASGAVYFSTDRGLVSYQGDAIAPVEDAGDLFVYPNPVGPEHDEIYIEGLVESARVRIVTPSGSLIAAFTSRGGRARWDGRDREGNRVSSGVYLVIAVGDEGQGTSYGRVAVIR